MATLIKHNGRRRIVVAQSALDITSGLNALSVFAFDIYIEASLGAVSNDAYVLRLPELEAEKLANTILERIAANKVQS